MTMEKDLTVGKPAKVLWKFCLPLLGSIVFQQMYNIADSLVAGKFIGDGALAAVGNAYEITLLFIAFAFGTNIGCSVIVSRLFGAKKFGDMKTAVYTTLLAGGALCGVLMLVGFFVCPALLAWIQTPPEVLDDCLLYLYIYIGGLPFLFFYNIATGVFSAMGDSMTPFLFLAVSSAVNVGADILFVAAFQMQVAGVAWATFICQGVSCLVAVYVVLRRLRRLKTDGNEKVKPFSWQMLGTIAVVAVPSICQQSFISVGNIIIQGVINGFGTAVMAGYSAAIKLNNLVITSLTTLGNGISNFTSQNLGAGKDDRMRQGYRAGLGMVWLLCVPVCVVYLTLGRFLLALFMQDAGGEAMQEGILILNILTPFYFIVSAKLVTDGVLRGMGKMLCFTAATFTDLVLRVVLAFVLSAALGSSLGVWWAWPIGWGVGLAVSVVCYFLIRRKKRRPPNEAATDGPIASESPAPPADGRQSEEENDGKSADVCLAGAQAIDKTAESGYTVSVESNSESERK